MTEAGRYRGAVSFGTCDEPLFLDGGLATELEAQGNDLSGDLWSARLLREDPDAIRRAHEAYFAAGAAVGISASYQASRAGFARHGLEPDDADELLRQSVRLVREAADNTGGPGSRYVAASVGPFGAIRHDGSEYRGRYGVPHDQLVSFHAERLKVLIDAGPDMLAIETVPDVDEARAILEALEQVGSELPAWLSFSCADGRTTNAGQPIEEAAALVAASARVGAVGVNCTAPEHVTELVTRINTAAPGTPIVVYPNAGRTWDPASERWHGDGSGVIPPQTVREWLAVGATAVGGCCGLGPTAIQAIASTTLDSG